MEHQEQPNKSKTSQAKETVKIVTGVLKILAVVLTLLGILIGIISWPLERKIVFIIILLVIWFIVEFLFWRQRRKRSSNKKLPWLVALFVNVQKELDPELTSVLREEQFFQIFRWSFMSLIPLIVIAAGIGYSEDALAEKFNPPTLTATFTPSPTITPSSTVTLTSTLLPTATPKEQGFYYMIVLDASLKMQEAFENQTKWDAARRAVEGLLDAFEEGANYGLVVIGGAPAADTSDPCSTASLGTLPFTTKAVVQGQVSQLQPRSGGSLYQAFVTAKSQIDHLPENTIRTLVYITGSEDACESEDEWANLERYFRAKGDDGLNIYSEIIIIDSKDGFKTQSIKERLSSISTKVNAHAPQTFFQLIQTNQTIINNINNYINITLTSVPTNTPTITPTATITATLRPGETYIPPPTDTATTTPTWTPTWTATLAPSLTPFVCPPFAHPGLYSGLGGFVSIDTLGDCSFGHPLEYPIYTSGSFSDLPPDTVIWELVYAPDGLYYPQSPNACGDHRPPDINGNTWQVNTYMGSATDTVPQWYEIVAVVADQPASAALSQWFIDNCPAFPGIPPSSLQQLNITEKGSVRVQTQP